MDNFIWAFGMWLTAVLLGSMIGLILRKEGSTDASDE